MLSRHRSVRARPLHACPTLALALAAATAATGCGGRYQSAAAPRSTASVLVAEPAPGGNTESYTPIDENQMVATAVAPISTFSIDVDTASYANVRRFLEQGSLPPPDAVRVEELINYFDYGYPDPAGPDPFAITSEVGPSPWHPEQRLVHIGLQGKRLAAGEMPPRNLVFLLDVSGSMGSPDKLPLLRSSLSMLVEQLGARDHVAIVVYAGASGVVLPPTGGDQRDAIIGALGRLEAGGSTNGAAGIEQAYALAAEHFDPHAINRVILATDGDFNVGVSDRDDLIRLIEGKRERGIYLTVLGFGMGNLKDSTMEGLADHGNGNYAYVDSLAEARKVLVSEAGGTLVTIARDVKLQVTFDPAQVKSYRLIGYENRMLETKDFVDDGKDAGEIGAGHSVTALYEIELADGLAGDEALMTVGIRYKRPDASESTPLAFGIPDSARGLAETSDDFRFAAAVAGYGMLLRGSPQAGEITWSDVGKLAAGALGADPGGYRHQFLTLVEKAGKLTGGGSQNRATIAN
jgi:Ca-activated chloride channel homolog